MGIIFNKLNKAIFLKRNGNLEEQIKELKKIPNYEKNEQIKKQIKLLEIGQKGEKNIEFELDNCDIGMYVIHDITIKQGDEKAQIDYIIVTRGYTYIVECKNLYGDIKIDQTGQFIRNFNNHTEAIYSPYRQATRHTELIKKIKFDNSRLISRLIINNYFDSWYKPLVVLSNSESILNKNFAPKEIKNNIIRVDQLINYIKNDLKKYDRKNLNTQKGMKELANNLLELNINEYNNFADKFKEKVNDNNQVTEKVKNNEFLKEKLILFRKEKSNRKNIPAYYIFTNEELEKITNIKPKTLNELKGILSDTKINFHGKEIIDIVNKF